MEINIRAGRPVGYVIQVEVGGQLEIRKQRQCNEWCGHAMEHERSKR